DPSLVRLSAGGVRRIVPALLRECPAGCVLTGVHRSGCCRSFGPQHPRARFAGAGPAALGSCYGWYQFAVLISPIALPTDSGSRCPLRPSPASGNCHPMRPICALWFFAAAGGGGAPAPGKRPEVGQPAPDFSVAATTGQTIHASDFKGRKTVVL